MIAYAKAEAADTAIVARLMARMHREVPHAKALPFLLHMVSAHPRASTIQTLVPLVAQSTVHSRVYREGGPPIGDMLRMARLVRVRAILNIPTMTVTHASHAMQYGSPQSVSRTTNLVFGVSPNRWRATARLDDVFETFFACYVTPYRDVWMRIAPDAVEREWAVAA